jgi:hypothetical protein
MAPILSNGFDALKRTLKKKKRIIHEKKYTFSIVKIFWTKENRKKNNFGIL